MTSATQSRHSRFNAVIDSAAGLAMLVAAITLTWTALSATPGQPPPPPPPPIPSAPLSLEGAALKGDPSAPVAVIEFSEFQCPFCAKFWKERLSALTERYVDKGRVVLAFRHFPLENIHSSAVPAAKAADCAGRQNKFWPMHDRLFLKQKNLDAETFRGHATDLGLSENQFTQCLEAPETEARVRKDIAEGTKLEVRGTPTIFVGRVRGTSVKVTKRLNGAASLAALTEAIDQAMGAPEKR